MELEPTLSLVIAENCPLVKLAVPYSHALPLHVIAAVAALVVAVHPN